MSIITGIHMFWSETKISNRSPTHTQTHTHMYTHTTLQVERKNLCSNE